MCEHLYTKEVQAIPFLCLVLYSLFPNCIKNDVTALHFSLDDRLEKPKSLLLLSLVSSNIILYCQQFETVQKVLYNLKFRVDC